MSLKQSFQDKDVQGLVGNLLRIGVIAAMTVVIAGMILYVYHNGNERVHYSAFEASGHRGGIATIFDGIAKGESSAIIELGVMLLIATPIARILFALIGYWLEKDYLYTFIALVILIIMAISIGTGAAG